MRIMFFLILTTFSLNHTAFAVADTSKPKYNIHFVQTKPDTIKLNETLREIKIEATDINDEKLNDYKIEISVDSKLSTFKNYEIKATISGKTFSELKDISDKSLIIKIKKEENGYRLVEPLELILKLRIYSNDKVVDADSNNLGKPTELKLVITPQDGPLKSYNFLGYLGTNFDLVDGIQAKNLFFGTNIFIPETRHWGFNLSLYGNRTMTKTDTSKQTVFESRIVKINNDSIARYYDTAMKVTTRVSDNIGINFMPLIALKFHFINEGPLKLYYAPQFEFIWRRTTIENAYLNTQTTRIDSIRNRFPANTAFPLVTPLSTKTNFNVYDAYLGFIGLLLRYETEEISVRINSSIGVNLNYTPLGALSNSTGMGNSNPVYPIYNKEKRFFYFGRLWITEPTTGLTLGAEISNYLGKRNINGTEVSKAQPYYNVTLSKAFDLKNLAALVKPIANR